MCPSQPSQFKSLFTAGLLTAVTLLEQAKRPRAVESWQSPAATANCWIQSACATSCSASIPPLTLQKQLHRRQHHLLLQERDLLLGVGIVNSAARQRLASAEQKQALQDLLAGCNQATGITCVAVHCGQGQSEQLADAGAGWSSE